MSRMAHQGTRDIPLLFAKELTIDPQVVFYFRKYLYNMVTGLHTGLLKKIYSFSLRDNDIFNCPLSSISQSQTILSPFFARSNSTIVLGIVVIKDWWEIPILVSYFILIPFCIFFNLYLYSFFCIYICSCICKYICIDRFIYYFLHSTIVSTFVRTMRAFFTLPSSLLCAFKGGYGEDEVKTV